MFVEDNHNIGTVDQISVQEADLIIFIGLRSNFNYYYHAIDQEPRPSIILLAREPVSYEPNHSRKIITKLSKQFDCVLTWMDDLETVPNIRCFTLPISPRQLSFSPDSDVTRSDSNGLLTNISSNKLSSHPEELYSERKRVIDFYHEHHPEKFGLYGAGWDTDYTPGRIAYGEWTPKSYDFYFGQIEHKNKVYDQYKFALAFENVTGLNGYISEKVFDVFASGRIPVYWGANNVGEYLPSGAYIDYRKFSHPSRLHKYLSEMTATEYERRSNIIKNFLSNESGSFRADHVASNVYDHIIDAHENNNEIHDVEYIRQLEQVNKHNNSAIPQIVEQSIRALITPPQDYSRFYILKNILHSINNYV